MDERTEAPAVEVLPENTFQLVLYASGVVTANDDSEGQTK